MNKTTTYTIQSMVLALSLVIAAPAYAQLLEASIIPLPNPNETTVTFYSEVFWGDSYTTTVTADNGAAFHDYESVANINQLTNSNLVVSGGSRMSGVIMTCRDHPATLVLHDGHYVYPDADERKALIVSCQPNETKRVNLHDQRTQVKKCRGWIWLFGIGPPYSRWLPQDCNSGDTIYWGDRVKAAELLVHPTSYQSSIPLQTESAINFSNIISSAWNLSFNVNASVAQADLDSGLNRPLQLDLDALAGLIGGEPFGTPDPVDFTQLSSAEIKWKTSKVFTIHQDLFLSSGYPFISGKRAWFEYDVIMNTYSGVPNFIVSPYAKLWVEGGTVYPGYGLLTGDPWYQGLNSGVQDAEIPSTLERLLNSAFGTLPPKQDYYFAPVSFRSQQIELLDKTATRMQSNRAVIAPVAQRPEWRFFLNNSTTDWIPIYKPILK